MAVPPSIYPHRGVYLVREPGPSIFIREVGLGLSLSNATRVQAGRKLATRAKAKLIDFLLATSPG